MKVNRTKKISISIAVCAILLSYSVFYPISVFAQEAPAESPDLEAQRGAEMNRYLKEREAAKPNEKTAPQTNGFSVAATKRCGWLDVECLVIKFLDAIVTFVILFPLSIAEFMFDKMIIVNLAGVAYQSGFVRAGWGISRDVANMFFIFFVLWMALATIFQFESYSAKRLLPKLIIVALLVNFSMPIGLFVIQTTNALAGVFYQVATGGGSLVQQILAISKFTETKQTVELSQKEAEELQAQQQAQQNATPEEAERARAAATEAQAAAAKKAQEICDQKFTDLKNSGILGKGLYALDTLNSALGFSSGYDKCISGEKEIILKGPDNFFYYSIIAVFWKLIIGIVATFVFLAGAIFLLVRYLSLAILLIFGPLAFLFMMLPGTQEYWNKWWNKLIQWSFFAPAFLFMIMLVVRLAPTLLTFQIQAAQNTEPANTPSLALQYILVMGLFIASLFVAQSMGIAMSGTVVGWGRSMARGAGRYAKGKGIQYAKIGAGGVAGGIQSNALLQKTLSSIPLLGGQIARGLGATRAVGEAAEKQRQRQKFGFAEKLSDEGRANYVASERPGAARDMLTKMDEGDRRRTVNALSTQGQIELAQKLRSVQSEALVGNATNNPEVYARISGEAGPLDSKDYPAKVAKIAHEKFKAENLASDFLRGAAGREYLKTATEDELKAIAKTRQGAEALGGTLAEIARTIHEEVTDARTDMQQRAVPYDLKQLTQTISNQRLSPQTQQYLNTAPGMYEGRMAMRIRGGGGGGGGRENNQEDDDENFMRMLQKAAKKGIFKPEE